jgi:outer membrane receptor protein involved in Fe transport
VLTPLLSPAQTTNAPPAVTGGTNAPAVTLEPAPATDRIIVEGIPIEEQIVPTVRPFNSVYGTDRSIIDTPRNVTIISREQLDAINIQDVRDFSKLTSSSYTRSNFGAPTTPDIRGQIADTFVNGMRIGLTSNGNGLPVNFNSVESVNIVKGPATAVYGPSQYVGGYVDLITKRPFYDAWHGEFSATVGMYQQLRWTADIGAPVDEKTAWRFSYSGEESGSYYYSGFRKSHAAYFALNHVASEKYEAFFNTEFFWANYTENFGANRPSQLFIDDLLYQTGVNINGPATDPQNAGNVTSGFPVVNVIAPGPLVPFDRRERLLKPGDDSEGYSVNAQLIQTYKANEQVKVVNNSFFRYVDRDTYSSYYYSEIISPSWSVQNRTEFQIDLDHNDINMGLDVRYQEVKAYNDFFNEPAAVWDLTRSRDFIDYFLSVNAPNPFTQFPVPGRPGRFYTPFNGDSGESQSFFGALFYQHDLKVDDYISLIFGGRGDFVSLDYQDPAGTLPGDSVNVLLPSVNGSLVIKPNPKLSTYLTYNWSQNPAGAVGNGGGFTTSGNAGFANGNLRTQAKLFEVGAKYSMLDGKLFLGTAVFNQTRANVNSQTRSVTDIVTKGFEFEANYQPSRNFFMTFGYSYLDSRIKAQTPGDLFDVANTTLTPFTDTAFSLTYPGTYRRQGVPEHLLNFLASYKIYKGFGVSANLVFHSDILNNNAGTIVIPPQYTVDMTLFYRSKSFDAQVAFLNVTDQINFSAPNGVYGNESIVIDLPFRIEAKATYRF